ncbi:hypothetical protein CFOL_v3_33424 [Cephalotus follicularis]|uniref:Uncharacterized protein n=1 Tax=Cephalotus follicularis TaxID=3775 RepID=A0A1Q3DC68_CEPFO|nr:hypothetical protein CFOL_v3_33424 [Cephalotus follicularis]
MKWNPSNEATGSSPFLDTFNDTRLLERVVHRQNYDNNMNSVDPRFLMLLEFFRQLYVRRRDLFDKLFPGLQDQFAELLKKFDSILHQEKSDRINTRALQRSMSLGSPRPPLKLERFKVRTVVVDDGSGQDDHQGQHSGASNST